MSSSSKAFERENHVQTYSFQGDDGMCDSDLLFYEELQISAHYGALDDLYLDKASPPFQACRDGLATPSSNDLRDWQPNEEEKRPYAFPSAAVEILKHFRSRAGAEDGGLKRDEAKGQRQRSPPSTMSVTQLIELAVRSFIHSNSETGKDFHLSAVIHPYKTAFSSLSRCKSEDVRLVQDLLSCARAVSNHSHDCASELLEEFSKLSSGSTKLVMQRLVYYFAESLYDRIGIEMRLPVNTRPLEFVPPISETAALIEKLPFNQVMQFAGVQAVLDHISSRAKVHVVDLSLYGGLRHAVLMQALATRSGCPLQHLKITAVAAQSNLLVEEAGVRLQNLAKSLNLSFSFHVITFEDILDLHQNVLRPDPEERVIVQAAHILRFMIPKLENLMAAIQSLNPHVMIITEVEANVDSAVFVNRFIEALLFFGASFEYVEHCLKDDLAARNYIESEFFSPLIRHVVAANEEERKFRIVGINFWRVFFARFCMVETELSKLALNHANSVLNMFDCRDSCRLGLDGNSLIVGWKDTPTFSLSAWKFQKIGSM